MHHANHGDRSLASSAVTTSSTRPISSSKISPKSPDATGNHGCSPVSSTAFSDGKHDSSLPFSSIELSRPSCCASPEASVSLRVASPTSASPRVRASRAGIVEDCRSVGSEAVLPIESHLSTQSEKERASCFDVLKLAYQSLGVIYGDMGTSPLYVFSSTFGDTAPNSHGDILGVTSLIFWTITVIALIKYVCIVLNADDNGEGGTAALYTLLCRHVKISLLISQHESDTRLTNYKRVQNQPRSIQNQTMARCKAALERSPTAHKLLLVIVMAGSCMLIGDGILTPAISDMVLLITCATLIALFMLQRFGTDRVSGLFAPVVLLWLTLIAGIGIYNIAAYRPKMFQAFSPHYGLLFLVHNKKKGWTMLGGVVLSITGTEAMFADLGHFSRRSIQVAFAGVVYPCLVLAYLGQAAYLTVHPEQVAHSFFKSIPSPLFWPMLVIATLATFVASQAMISGAFSVINQSLNLGCFPRVKVIHTSKTVHGQIYIPEVNYALMISCVAVVLSFKHSFALGNAYGIAVVSVMLITTCLMSLVIVLVWQHHLMLGILFLCTFGSVEGLYLSSVLYKISLGGWVPLVIAAAILSIMCVWQYGASEKHKFELKHMVQMDQLDRLIADSRIIRVPGLGLFYTNSDTGVPPTFWHFIDNLPALHQIMVFVCIKYVPVTQVLPEERVFLRHLPVQNFYQTVIRYGYNETPMAGEAFDDLVVGKIAELIKSGRFWRTESPRGSTDCSPEEQRRRLESTSGGPSDPLAPEKSVGQISAAPQSQAELVQAELAHLYDAKEKGVVYVVGYTQVQAKAGSSCWKRFLIDIAYCILCKYCRSNVIMLNIPTQRLIEVGMIYDL